MEGFETAEAFEDAPAEGEGEAPRGVTKTGSFFFRVL